MLKLMRRADGACARTRWQHFSAWNDVMVAILNIWRQIKHPTYSINAYLLQEQFCQISSKSDLKRQSLALFWRGHPTRTTTIRWAVIWDQYMINIKLCYRRENCKFWYVLNFTSRQWIAKHGNLANADASGTKSTKHPGWHLEIIQGQTFWDHWKAD